MTATPTSTDPATGADPQNANARPAPTTELAELAELAGWDWAGLGAQLDAHGHAVTPRLLTGEQCRSLAGLYGQDERFRATVDMARHRFGQGEYRYFTDPLPEPVAALRAGLYPPLASIAGEWNARLGSAERYPPTLGEYLQRCAAAGQTRPTPLLLRYHPGGYNCLHQDIYGAQAFPLQVAVALDVPEVDFTGGDFLLVENHPRAQSRGAAVSLPQGHGVIFPTRHWPVASRRGSYRAAVRHGVSPIRSGHRHTLGLIFHDAA